MAVAESRLKERNATHLSAVLQALLVDPIVDAYGPVEEMLDTMLELQAEHLGYIR